MVVAVAGYAYRFELQGVVQHVLGALMPYRGEEVGKGSISFDAWPDGQFRIDAMVNGTPVMFLVDTRRDGRGADVPWATISKVSISASCTQPLTAASWRADRSPQDRDRPDPHRLRPAVA
jgi:hypothetical protein